MSRLIPSRKWPLPIHEMLLAIDRRNELPWTMSIVNALESRAAGGALDLGIAAIRPQLPDLGGERVTLATKWLADLEAMKRASVDPAAVTDLGRTIWYHGGMRDRVQTAISRLYWAFGSLAAKNDQEYRREVAWALELGASDSDNRPNIDRLHQLIDLFLQKTERSSSSPEG